jgi:hypothetical protein
MKNTLFYISIILLASCSLGTLEFSNREPANLNRGDDCRDVARAFMASNPVKSGPILSGERSIGSKIPNFEDFRSKLITKRPSLDKYAKRFADENSGRLPTVKEALEFYKQGHEDVVNHIRSAKGLNEELDLYLEMSAVNIELSPSKLEKVNDYLTNSDYREVLSKNFKMSDSSQRPLFDSLGWTNYKGHIGELDVLLRLENLQAQGVYLKQMNLLNSKSQEVNDILSSALERRLESISVGDIPNLKRKFPKVFKDNGESTDEQILSKAKTFLDTKEFDLIVKKHGRYSIVEVKNYKHPISMSDMRVDAGNKKTILDQQLETIDIIKFLGLEDKFYPSVAFLRGVRRDAREKLESHGISVLADVVD